MKATLYTFTTKEELNKKQDHEEEDEEDQKKKKKDEEVVNKKYMSTYDLKCVLTAKFAGVELDVKPVEGGVFNKTPEFLKKSVTGSLPLLETEKGNIWQSNAIMRYLASQGKNKDLRGDGIYAAQVDQIIDYVEANFGDVLVMIHLLLQGKKVGKLEQKAAETQLEKVNTVLGHILEVNTFLAGERISMADLYVFSNYRWLYVLVWEQEERKKYRSITRWFQSISNHKLVKEVVGEIKLKEKKEKKIESTFNMEEWKRVYMNSPASESAAWFWSKLDLKVNSIWVANFKFNEDLKGEETYVIMNRLGGVQQRLQDFSKSTFGVMAVVQGKEYPEITCLWVYESKTVPKEIASETDYEMYSWTRMDWKNDKALVEEYLKQEGSIQGKTLLESKTFR